STAYGSDMGLTGGLTSLLAALAELEGLRWIRLYYLFPNKVASSLLDLMASRENIASYVDLPLQHAAGSVLARMRRGGSAKTHMELLERIRRTVPGVAIRTTMIVGFPGESHQEFQSLCEFVRQARFESLGTFIYSHEEETPAFRLEDDVCMEAKEERQAHLMAIQETIALEQNRARVGKTLEVLCEGTCTETDHLLQGRLESQASEIDGRILINEGEAIPGRFYRVQITEAHPFDLVGRVLGPA
ncbi:MAG: radical SAM protein, partial [Acidobacteriota bacterium]